MILDDEALVERVARAIDPRAFGEQEILHSLGSFDARPERQRVAKDTALRAIEAVRVHMWDDGR